MPPTYRYDHMHLRSRDVKKTAEYYHQMFDAKIVESIQSDGRPRTDLDLNGLTIFIAPVAPDVPDVPAHYEAGINRGLGVPSAFYHFAFEAGSEAALVEKRNELIARGVEVTDVVDHDWAKSIYFKDPNGLQLEFCCFTRNLNDDDARLQLRNEVSIRRMYMDAGIQSPAATAKVS